MVVLAVHHLRLLSAKPQIVVIPRVILVVSSILRIWRNLYVSVVVGTLLHWRVAVVGSTFLAEKLIFITKDIHFYHVVLFQVRDFIIERLHFDHMNTILVLLGLLFLLSHFFDILVHLVEFILQRLNLSILILALSLEILAHVLKFFDGAIEITKNPLLFILLQVLLFLDFLFALIYILLELVQKLRELDLQVLVFFRESNLLVIEFFLFVLNMFNPLFNIIIDFKLLIQSSIFIFLKAFLLLNYLVSNQNRGYLTLRHLLNFEEFCHLVCVCDSCLILLVCSFTTFLTKATSTLPSQWHLRILKHFEITLIHLLLIIFVFVHERHVVQNLIHVKIE